MSSALNLLPQPQSATITGGAFSLGQNGRIALNLARPADLFFAARQLQSALETATAGRWSIAAGDSGKVTLSLDAAIARAQGYRLTVAADGIVIAGHDPAGVFYGVQTLRQLLQTQGAELPQLVIDDFPDFPARGVMHDISRGRVSTMETLYDLIDRLASWKVNQFQLYMEHTFAYQAPSRSLAARLANDGGRAARAGRLLPRAPYRARAQPELLRAHGALV